MLLARLLNACHHFPGFVYAAVRLIEATSTIEVDVRPRRSSKPHCSCCGNISPGYDVLAVRRFEFIPIRGYAVMLLYAMRRVQCRQCGVKVEQVPWAMGKHTLTKAYMLYLAHWACKLSWKETALSFGTTWDQVCYAVEPSRMHFVAEGSRRRLVRVDAQARAAATGRQMTRLGHRHRLRENPQ